MSIIRKKTTTRNNVRNLAVHLSDAQKTALKGLAAKSGMTLTAYVEAVLSEASTNGDVFEVEVVTRKR